MGRRKGITRATAIANAHARVDLPSRPEIQASDWITIGSTKAYRTMDMCAASREPTIVSEDPKEPTENGHAKQHEWYGTVSEGSPTQVAVNETLASDGTP